MATENPIACSRSNNRASGKFTRLKAVRTAITRRNAGGSGARVAGSVRTGWRVSAASLDCRLSRSRLGSCTSATSATLNTAGITAIHRSGRIL